MADYKIPPDHHIALTAKRIVVNCFRNTALETFHAGSVPTTKSGDYSDVKVIDGEGKELGWNECSHIDDAQMEALMQDCVSRVYTVLKYMDDEAFAESLARYDVSISRWDRPKPSRALLGQKLYKKLCADMDSST